MQEVREQGERQGQEMQQRIERLMHDIRVHQRNIVLLERDCQRYRTERTNALKRAKAAEQTSTRWEQQYAGLE